MCDSNYCFTFIDIGQYGSNNDSRVLSRSKINEQIENSALQLPQPATLDGCNYDPLPYFLVGDEIFPLKSWLMHPYPCRTLKEEESIYNYRHSRARRVIENTFRILIARWRILSTPIVVHNYLRLTENATYCPSGCIDSENSNGPIVPGDWRSLTTTENNLMINVPPVRGSRYCQDALAMRDALIDFVKSEEGHLEWQIAHVRRT